MDNGDEHTYPPGHVSIDPNQLNMMENMFQAWMLEMKRAVQQQLAAERANWAQESRTQEAVLEKQIEELQQQLSNTQLHPSPKQRCAYALSLLIVIYDFSHSKSSPVTPCHSTRSMLAFTSQSKKGLKPSTVNLASLTSGFSMPQASELTTKSQKVTTPHKPATHIHHLLESEVPEDTRGIKVSNNS